MPNPSILIVDDDQDTRLLLQEIMEKEGYDVLTAGNAKSALTLVETRSPDVVLSDIQMPNVSGIELLAVLQQHHVNTHVILLTAYGSLASAVAGINAGAFDYLTKPFVLDEVRGAVRRALDHQQGIKEYGEPRNQAIISNPLLTLQGKSPALVGVYKMIARVAPTDTTVLVQGESGTGKELVARAIHANSLRKNGPFVPVDCGTLTDTLLESELFGHERGAFTGAVVQKKGLLEAAAGGTCFLDEIGDISVGLQSKLLRVLQEHEIRRVGGMTSIDVDVRIVAATNKNLMQLVEERKFREDLYYRLNVVAISIPPLRDRPQDIPELVNYFLDRYGMNRDKSVKRISPQAMALLKQYWWPGNVRELEHAIERACVCNSDSVLLPQDLPEAVMRPRVNAAPTQNGWKTLQQVEKEHILRVLEAFQGDENLAAEVLGVHRKTIQRKLKEYGLS